MSAATIRYADNLDGINWVRLRDDLIADDFHNGRTPAQLQASFENSAVCVMAWHGARCVGNARALSDGVGNAYVLDVWTQSSLRGQGIGRTLMQQLLAKLPGQHVYLQTDSAVGFYTALGFEKQPEGMFRVVGNYLQPD